MEGLQEFLCFAPSIFHCLMSTFSFSLDGAVKRLPNKSMDAEVAQPVEQRIRNAWVVSSNLILGSSFS